MEKQYFTRFVSAILNSRTQAHIFHLKSTSYAKHKALNDYYDSIIDLIDGLVESVQGKYGLLENYKEPSQYLEDNEIEYFEKLVSFTSEIRTKFFQDSFIQNDIDEIEKLIYSTLYKLKYLS